MDLLPIRILKVIWGAVFVPGSPITVTNASSQSKREVSFLFDDAAS